MISRWELRREAILLRVLFCAALRLVVSPGPAAAQTASPPVAMKAQQEHIGNLIMQAFDAMKGKNYDAAEKAAREALKEAQDCGDGIWTASSYNMLGKVFQSANKNSEAEINYKKALESLQAQRPSEPCWIAFAFMELASVAAAQGHTAQSEDYFRAGAAGYERVSNKTELLQNLQLSDSFIEAMGQRRAYLPYFEEALKLQRNYGESADQMRGRLYLGLACLDNGGYNNALDNLQQAAAIADNLEDHSVYGLCMSGEGAAYLGQGKTDKAYAVFRSALPAFQESHQYAQVYAIALSLKMLSAALGHSEDTPLYDALMKETQPYAANSPQMAPFHFEQALLLICAHKQKEAWAEIQTGCSAEKTEQDKALEHLCKAQWYLAARDYKRAEPECKLAYSACEKLGQQFGALRLNTNYGSLYLRQGRYREARAEFERSLKEPEVLGNPLVAGSAHFNLGAVACYQKDYATANAELEKSAEVYENFYGVLVSPAQIGAFQQFMDGSLYGMWAMSLRGQNHPMQALLTAERGQASGLQMLRSEANGDLSALPDSARKQWREAQANARQAFAQWGVVGQAPDLYSKDDAARATAEKRFVAAQEQWEKRQSELQKLQAAFRRQYPAFQQAAKTPLNSETLKAMSRRKTDTLFIETAIVDDATTLIFTLRGGALHVFSTPHGDADWEDAAENWRQAMADRARLQDDPDLREYGRLRSEAGRKERIALSAFSQIIAPVERAGLLDAKGLKRLVFVTNAALANVPFCALGDRRGNPLIKRFACANSLSLALLCGPDSDRRPTAKLLCLANPSVAPRPPARSRPPERTAGGAQRLPRLEQSAHEIAALFSGAAIKIGSEANRAAALDMGRYALLFFGVHGILKAEDGLSSFLRLAYNPAQSASERLEAREIMNLRLNAELVALASCNAANGEQAGGEGLQGLAWAFQAAGCRAVIAPQWAVQQKATALLMTTLFQHLRRGEAKDEALRQAILTVSQQKEFKEPYFWAGLPLFGDARPLSASLRGGAKKTRQTEGQPKKKNATPRAKIAGGRIYSFPLSFGAGEQRDKR